MNAPLQNAQFTRAFDGAKDDDSVIPRFYIEAEEIVVDGESVYRDAEFVEITMPGNPLTRPVFRVDDRHRKRWPNQYAAFKANQEAPIDGIPLSEWPVLKPAQILKLKSLGFRTVENLATMGDLACQNIGLGGMQLRQKAKAYLDEAAALSITNKAIEDAAKWERLANDLRAQVERTNEAMSQMQQEMQALRMNQHLAVQNIGATPQVQAQAFQQMQNAQPSPAAAMFSDFAAPSRSRIRGELKALSDAGASGGGVQHPLTPTPEVVTVAPALPKRRGRPPKTAQSEAAHG